MRKFIYLFIVTIIIFVVCGIIYPLTVTLISQTFLPEKANGSLLYANEEVIGAKYIGQDFTNSVYFYSRSSLNNYAGASGFDTSNWNYDLNQESDFMNSYSGSNLEPYILYEDAIIQIDRVSAMTGISKSELQKLIDENTITNGYVKIVNTTTLNYAIYNILY